MGSPPSNNGDKIPKQAPGVVGAGGGTLLVLLANNIPDDNPWKSWLVIIAPTASVVLAAGMSWVRRQIEEALQRRAKTALINRARKTLQDGITDPNTSEETRAQLRADLEELNRLVAREAFEKARAIFTKRDS